MMYCRVRESVRVQLHLHHLRGEYFRLQEWPYSSDTKLMAVKCASKRREVSEVFLVFLEGPLCIVLERGCSSVLQCECVL